tara:strand:- start:218 stop:709 length:492 start_codon:yes stop_codon:yes gene_type:complete
MSTFFRNINFRILNLAPLILLFLITLTGNAVINISFISINILYVLVYFWALKSPESLGNGYIFLGGIITDVIFGLPIGTNPFTLLIIASVASYVRNVTVRITLINDWISFLPTLIIANFVYFIILYLLDYQIDYIYLLKNSIFTFIFYPMLWVFFSITLRLIK